MIFQLTERTCGHANNGRLSQIAILTASARASLEIPVSLIAIAMHLNRGTHCTGKMENGRNKFCVRENTGKFGNVAITGNLVVRVVNSLNLKVKVKDISMFAAEISKKKLKLDKSAKSVL